MRHPRLPSLLRLLTLLCGLLIAKVLVTVALNFADYFPPRFDQGFLSGRADHFFGAYSWAFYVHIFAGPLSLFLGTLLTRDSFRLRFPGWHRKLGRIQVVSMLFFVAPSGLWMARYAESGPIAGVGFAVLAVATAYCAAMGWRSAVRRRFVEHRRWMWRGFVLLCSAVVIRFLGGIAVVNRVYDDWAYQTMAWVSWLVPLVILEATFRRGGSRRNGLTQRPPRDTEESHVPPVPL